MADEMNFFLSAQVAQTVADAGLSVGGQIDAPDIIMFIKHTMYTVVANLTVVIAPLQGQQRQSGVEGVDFRLETVDTPPVGEAGEMA